MQSVQSKMNPISTNSSHHIVLQVAYFCTQLTITGRPTERVAVQAKAISSKTTQTIDSDE